MKSGDKTFDLKSKEIIKESSGEEVKLRNLISKLSSAKAIIFKSSKKIN